MEPLISLPISYMTFPISSPSNHLRPALLEKLLFLILVIYTGQLLIITAFSFAGGLQYSWMASFALLAASAAAALRFWKDADTREREVFIEPWLWFLPWTLLALLALQILAYPSVMNDSLSYRIPRIYLWLQEGSIVKVESADWRINAMTYGWESMALPFYSLNLPKFARLNNLFMWIASYQIIHHWARNYGAHITRSRWIAIAMVTTPGFTLQAVSTANDFFVCALLLIGVYFILAHEKRPGPLPVLASLIALIIAANVKPQFLVMCAGWGLWWAFGTGRPWKQVSWTAWIALSPLLILISPLPKLFENFVVYGSIGGNPLLDPTQLSVTHKVITNSLLFTFSQLQLPVMPNVSALNAWVNSMPLITELHRLVPKFGFGLNELTIIDSASYGFFHAALILTGLLAGWKHCNGQKRWIALAVLPMFLLAATQISVSTIGRSFMGFAIPLFPLVIYGLINLRSNWQLIFIVLTGCTSIVLNPSHPLWPCNIAEAMARTNRMTRVTEKIESYNLYRKRALTGKGILTEIPENDTVGVLLRQITPISNLWHPHWQAHRIEFIHNQRPDQFQQSQVNWLLIGEKSEEQFPDIFKQYQDLANSWEKVRTIAYRPTFQQGPESWTLYHRKPTQSP
jgi:hypothetical protein